MNTSILYFIHTFFISESMSCAERGMYGNLNMHCYAREFRHIQTVQATLVRLPSVEKCDGVTFDDGDCVCETESKMITQQLQRCKGESNCDYVLSYPNSSDCLEPAWPPILLQIEYECGICR